MAKTISSLIVAASLCVAGAPAFAAGAEHATATIRHADLNLASDAGVQTFRSRAEAAAGRACGTPDGRIFREVAATEGCRTSLLRHAEAKLAALAPQVAPQDIVGTR